MWLLLAALPLGLYLALLFPDWRVAPWLRQPAENPKRSRERKRAALWGLAAGIATSFVVGLLTRGLSSWLGVDPKAQITGGLPSILTALLLFAPLDETSKVLAIWPLRGRFLRGSREGAVLGSAVALGFACVEMALFLRPASLAGWEGALVICRAAFGAIARTFAGAVWGYALGAPKPANRRLGRTFVLAWCAATALRGLYDHLVFGRGVAPLIGSIPLFLGMIVVFYLAAREMAPRSLPRFGQGRLSFLPSLPPPPSLRAMRDALKKAERPVMLHWIPLGALVTMGVIITAVAGAVVLGQRLGVDFSAVDEGQVAGAIPLVFIGVGVLLAFPASGYLVARASGADSVLEAALSTGLAIVGTLVMLGLAAPVAVVFALAFAPIAFGLACAGAWVGAGGAHS